MDISPLDLTTLGWDSDWERAFASLRPAGWEPARVSQEDKHWFRVVTAQGEMAAQIAGRLLKERNALAALPKVGDWVALARLPGEDRAVIQQVLPRRSQIVRKVPGREIVQQVLAANVDVAFIVQALDQTYNLRRLERFLVMAHEGGAQPVIVLNKCDLCEALEARTAETLRAAGATPLVVTCARTGRGMQELAAHLRPGRTGVFVGTSGVGKSSLINRLYGEAVQATIEVREHDAKGRHTTAWRELIPLPGGALVIDTPGMREFHLWLADGEGAFPDVTEWAAGCRFRDCSHTVEAGCAVRAAVEAGQLAARRYESYVKLRRELKYLAAESRQHTYRVNKRGTGRPRPPMED